MTDLEQLEAIAKGLASLKYPGSYSPSDCHMGDDCEVDEFELPDNDLRSPLALLQHSNDCPFRMAVEYVNAKEGKQ